MVFPSFEGYRCSSRVKILNSEWVLDWINSRAIVCDLGDPKKIGSISDGNLVIHRHD